MGLPEVDEETRKTEPIFVTIPVASGIKRKEGTYILEIQLVANEDCGFGYYDKEPLGLDVNGTLRYKSRDVSNRTSMDCSDMDRCASCGKPEGQPRACTACRSVAYCNVACQRAHRHIHKAECKRIEKELKKKKQQSREDGDVVGYIQCHIMERNEGLFEVADGFSNETYELAHKLCDSDGTASRVDHPALGPGKADRRNKRGGFLHVHKVEIQKDHQHQDLGLLILHQVLDHLHGEWSLAAMKPETLDYFSLRWKENDIFGRKGMSRFDDESPLTLKQEVTAYEAGEQIARHFARIGFVQANKTSPQGSVNGKSDIWFVTDDMYFTPAVDDLFFADDYNRRVKSQWLTKEEARQVFVHKMYSEKQLLAHEGKTELDKELGTQIKTMIAIGYDKDIDGRLRDLLHRGGNLDKIWAIHVVLGASFHGRMEEDASCELIDFLLDRGASIDGKDYDGVRPLHLAVYSNQETVVRHLLKRGADPLARNDAGETPIDYARAAKELYESEHAKTNQYIRCDGIVTPMNQPAQDKAASICRLLESRAASS